jgi:hypothetical protein
MKKACLAAVLLLILTFLSKLDTPPAQALSQAMVLPNHTGYLDLTTIPATYHVVGEMTNTGTVGLKWLIVTATFYDQNNLLIGSSSSYAFLDVLLPGRKAPFEVVWANTTANQVHNYALSLQYSEYTVERPLALQILENITYVDEAGFQKINGTIKNLATSNATGVKVVATFYDTQGKVVGATYGYTTPSTIMPNQTERFELELKRKGLFFPNYSLTAESMEYALVPELSQSNICILLIILTSTFFIVYFKRHHISLNR